VEGISVCELTAKDVVRHPLVMRIIRAYEKEETEKCEERETTKDTKQAGKRKKELNSPAKTHSGEKEGE
jgi:phosphate starvation-inducible PhoH-like protein